MERTLPPEEIRSLGKNLLDWNDGKIDDFLLWIDQFPSSGRAPSGKKEEFQTLKEFHRMAKLYREEYKNFGIVPQPIGAKLSWFDEADIDRYVDTFINNGKKPAVSRIERGRVTYVNDSTISERKFKQMVKAIGDHINSLQGYHKKTLAKPFEVHIKSPTEQKSWATYKSDLDQIWVKSNPPSLSNAYGHLLYVITHELGHREERMHGLPEGFTDNEYRTTRYSWTEALGASEAFAEVFAISHAPEDYPQHADTIKKFQGLMARERAIMRSKSMEADLEKSL